MAVTRVRLLLLFLVASTACDSNIIPSEFLCNEVERGRLRNQAENLLNVMTDCSDLTQLTGHIRLPDSRVHKETWEKTPFQDRMAEVLQALSNLVKDVESTSVPSVCGSSLLEMLAHNARNYLRILPSRETTRPLQNSKRPNEKYSSDLRNILRHFDSLLKGKLEMLMMELEVQKCS